MGVVVRHKAEIGGMLLMLLVVLSFVMTEVVGV